MPRYTDESVDRVKDAIDMVDLVSAKTELRRAGANRLEGLCPFHDERTPSFGIDPVQKVYHCFGCGVGGDGITFVRETEGVDFIGAIELLADRYGIQLEVADEDPAERERRRARERLYELLERTARYYTRILWESREAEGARKYLLERGLTEESLRKFRLGFAPNRWDTVLMASRKAGFSNRELFDAGLAKRGKDGGQLFDMFRARITFPLTDMRGRVIGFGARQMSADRGPKYLNTPEGVLFHKRFQVYGADVARAAAAKAGSVILAEGYTDVIMLHQAGFENVVGIMGTSLTEEQVKIVRRLAPVAQLALDADNAGQKAMLRAAQVAGSEDLELRVVPLPAGLDPADLVVERGASAVAEILDRKKSIPFTRFRVERALDRGDLSSAEGKEAVLEEVRPDLARVSGLVRHELIGLVSDRLNVGVELLEQLLRQGGGSGSSSAPPQRQFGQQGGGGGQRQGGGGGQWQGGGGQRRGGSGSGSGSGGWQGGGGQRRGSGSGSFQRGAPQPQPAASNDAGPDASYYDGLYTDDDPYAGDPGPDYGGGGAAAPGPPSALSSALAQTEEVERRFLAFCVALPDQGGSDALAKIDPATYFTSSLLQRAAEHLRTNGLSAAADSAPEGDHELSAFLRELAVRAGREPATPATLDAQRLQLELRRLDRQLKAAASSGAGGVTDLARQKIALQAEFHAAIERASAN